VNQAGIAGTGSSSPWLGRARLLAAVLLAAASGAWAIRGLHAQAAKAEEFSKYVDASGGISLPEDFETAFVHLGTVAVAPKPDQPVNELHGTYTRTEDLAAFLRDGKFPDGAVLVKDVRTTSNSKLTTGAAAYGADVKVWFVMIKDSKGRFPENDLWGDGWGWGLFEGKDRTKQVAVNYATECRTCHVPAKKQDWVYTQCYPALRAQAKAAASAVQTEEAPGM
jgi:cytochrome c